VARCDKTYVVQFGEAEGFEHLHFHVVPRPRDLPGEHRGPGVFHYLRQPQEQWLSEDDRAEVAAKIARLLA
jgi:diadenosine tetraphosphate (Ap4A) HIT family hydrolase